MNKKKQTQSSISQGESKQAQSILTHYHQIATQLRTSTDEQETQAALAEINTMSAGTQIAFLKELAREQHVDAADVLAALHAFGTLKEARKEARRSLIRLEGAKIYPLWEAPSVPSLEDNSLQTANFPPRFFKGLVTDSRHTGEIQLILCWEMGEDYREVRVLGFLLEFWRDGIKDFFTLSETKRSFANLLTRITERLGDVHLKESSLAEGIGLLEEAKAVNARYGTKPHRDYTAHRALINQFIPENLALQIASEVNIRNLDEEEIDLSALDPLEIVANFLEALVEGDLSIAYQTLAQDSPLREALTKDAWIERRTDWAEKFAPTAMEPNLLFIREPQKQKLWLPTAISKKDSVTTKEVEAGWSMELEELLSGDNNPLPELPTPVIVYSATKRHWFWASFTLVQENNAWRIQSMTDEYLKAQELSVATIKKRIEEFDQRAEKAARHKTPASIEQMNDAEQEQYVESLLLPMQKTLYYADILTQKEPLVRSLCEEASTRAAILSQYEHSLVHLQALLERFPEAHALIYQRSADLQQLLATRYAEEDDYEHETFYLEQAEKSLFAMLALEETAETRISLAEVLLEQDDRLDEAKNQLLQAKNAVNKPDEVAHIEMHLGNIALQQEQLEVGLNHFQRVVELRPTDPDGWEALGAVQRDLDHFEEAETSYKRAIELNPDDPEYYSSLGLLYKIMNQHSQAVQILKDGLVVNPTSVELHLYLAAAYESINNFQQAQDCLEQAEHLDPGSETVAAYRRMFELNKLDQRHAAQKPLKLTGPKKKRPH